ncbi:hypothetical protein AB0D98_18915 [Streptomyces sp. NPDC047987]|uniref:hypothetical protein n=1 Tax=unclassified Streptomyces TaxID=2593676 RepID=UPI00341A8818
MTPMPVWWRSRGRSSSGWKVQRFQELPGRLTTLAKTVSASPIASVSQDSSAGDSTLDDRSRSNGKRFLRE